MFIANYIIKSKLIDTKNRSCILYHAGNGPRPSSILLPKKSSDDGLVFGLRTLPTPVACCRHSLLLKPRGPEGGLNGAPIWQDFAEIQYNLAIFCRIKFRSSRLAL